MFHLYNTSIDKGSINKIQQEIYSRFFKHKEQQNSLCYYVPDLHFKNSDVTWATKIELRDRN